MTSELSAADRASLAAEQGPVNMAVGGVLVFEEPVDHGELLARLEGRLHLVPRYRQRLRTPAPGLNPSWVDDPAFDLGWHVRRATLSAQALPEFVGHEMSRRLDRARPLWELTVIDGDRPALLVKMHHALVDGMAAIGIGMILLDPTPEPMELPDPAGEWRPRRYDRRRHLAKLAVSPVGTARRLMTPRDPRDLRKATELLTQLARTRPAAPMTPLNRGLGPNRRYAMVEAPLADFKRHGKVNDVLLAVVSEMLRVYSADDVVALVPVSVRKEGEEGGNRISTVLVDLPVSEPDFEERLARVSAEMQDLKDSAAVRAGAILAGATGMAPPVVATQMARALGGVRAFNLVVSNVPGPQQPFYLNGSRLLEAYPAVPLNPVTQGLTVGILSYDGRVCFGLLADRDLDPPVEVAAEAIRTALAAL